MTKKVLITGGFGFIGEHLVDYLTRRSDITVKKLPYSIDILDRDKLHKVFVDFQPNVVVHAAAFVSSVLCEFAGRKLATKVNVEGTENIAKLSNKLGSKLIYLGSTASYKPVNKLITELTPSKPTTIYGKTKYEGEKMVSEIADDWLILRLAYVFGPNDHTSNVSALITGWREKRVVILHADPKAKKDYLYIDDCVKGLSFAIEKDLSGFYNISRQDPRKVFQIIAYLKEKGITPTFYLRPEKDYLGTHTVSSKKFRDATGWNPKITVEKGIDLCLSTARR